MILKKIHFVIDKTTKDNTSQKIILKRYRNYSPNQSNVIVVIGGDGFMLETLKKYRKYNKPFYGMNKGTFGFLMNKFKLQNLKKNISRAKLVSISPLETEVKTKKNKILSLQEHLKKGNDDKPVLIYKKHIVDSGLVETYAKDINESVKKRDKIAMESFKYMMEKTKGLNF